MTDERTNDLDAYLAAENIARAVEGNAKKLALAMDVTDRQARRYLGAERSSPSYRQRKLIEGAPDPMAPCVDMLTVATRTLIGREGPMPEWRWVHLMRDVLRKEQEADGTEDSVTQLWLQGEATHRDLWNADAEHARWRVRRMALLEIGMRLGYTLTGGGK